MADDIDAFENYEILEDYYVIEAILEKKKQKGVWKYKVKWEGYPMDQCTWEPRENLHNCKELLQQFEANLNTQKNSSKVLSTKPKVIKEENESPITHENSQQSPSDNKIVESTEDIEMKAPVLGSFDTDVGDRIIQAKIIDDVNIELNCLVCWKMRKDGTQADNAWISSNIVRKKDPELLLKFYEKKIVFPTFNPESNNKKC
jgi:hypothetical protein